MKPVRLTIEGIDDASGALTIEFDRETATVVLRADGEERAVTGAAAKAVAAHVRDLAIACMGGVIQARTA